MQGDGRRSNEHTAILVFKIEHRPVVGPAADVTHGENVRRATASRSTKRRWSEAGVAAEAGDGVVVKMW